MSGSHFNTLRGFRDLLGEDCRHTEALKGAAREAFELYGFSEIRTPILEQKELFVKSTGETSDIVEKEMYELSDAGGRFLALRPEGTPGVVRAYLNNNLGKIGPSVQLFYIGAMFRAERPQAGRFREFEQIGAETIGNSHPSADVTTILCLKHTLDSIGLVDKTRLRLNNIGCDAEDACRPRYRARLREYLDSKRAGLCDHCLRRIERNPLRALDCKKDGPTFTDAPALEPCAKCRSHVDTVSALLAQNGCPHIYPDPHLVRGLDYYTSTVFEFQSAGVGAQDAIAGGGRYDALVGSMGGPDTPAVGWALGVERTLLAARDADPGVKALTKIQGDLKTDVFIVTATKDDSTVQEGVKLMETFRRFGIRAGGGLFDLGIKAQMREADRRNSAFTVILGADELAKSPPTCMLKEMGPGHQVEIPLSDLLEVLGDQLLPRDSLLSQKAHAG